MDEIDIMLNEELKRQLNELGKAQPGSDDARRLIDDFVELQKQALEKQKMMMDAEKQDADRNLAREKAEAEIKAKEEDRKLAKKQGIVQAVIQGVGVGATTIATFLGLAYTNKHVGEVLMFEKTGNIGSTVGRGLFGSMFRKK